ncbi:MAG: Phosphate transport system permease protein [Succiniclasticum sp.]|jgi:phosphate transport system permease protein
MNKLDKVMAKTHRNERTARILITACGICMALVPILIGLFLFFKGTVTFTQFHHSLTEFLFSGVWNPSDTAEGGGQVGAAIFLTGTLAVCLLSLVLSMPFSMATAIFMTEMTTPKVRRLLQPAVELFTGIPSVVYGFVGMTVLIPFLKSIFPMPFSFSLLAAGIVLAIMIFPTITTMTADALASVPKSWREASYGLGATRWETIAHVVLPAAKGGIATGVILGLTRAMGEALAVAMVIGQMKIFPTSLFMPASTLTTAISADMGGAMEGGEYNAALWSMALVLFILSFAFIFLIHHINEVSSLKGGR